MHAKLPITFSEKGKIIIWNTWYEDKNVSSTACMCGLETNPIQSELATYCFQNQDQILEIRFFFTITLVQNFIRSNKNAWSGSFPLKAYYKNVLLKIMLKV